MVCGACLEHGAVMPNPQKEVKKPKPDKDEDEEDRHSKKKKRGGGPKTPDLKLFKRLVTSEALEFMKAGRPRLR